MKETVAFYETVFGLKRRFIHESELYAEMETGSVTLAFSQYELIETMELNFQKTNPLQPPFGLQATFEPDDVDMAYAEAVAKGAESVKAPTTMPWGWRCAFVRDCNGFLIELAKELK